MVLAGRGQGDIVLDDGTGTGADYGESDLVMGRYLKPYRKYLAGSVVLNFLAQWLNVFSFVVLIPILNILFKIDTQVYTWQPIDWSHLSKEALQNNGYAYVQELIAAHGEFMTLVMMGVTLIVMTGLKTFFYFASSAVMVPLRTGIVRDIRVEVYRKVLSLPLSFFSDFSNKSVLCIRWPKYWSFSFSISPSSEYSGLISFRID